MPRKHFLLSILLSCIGAVSAHADGVDDGMRLLKQGNLLEAARRFNEYAIANPDGKKTPEALALCGRILDHIVDSFGEAAEKRCYWIKGAPRAPQCMKQQTSSLNLQFGEDAFRYEHAITYISYTGVHYRTLLKKFPKSRYVAEADFYLLLREMAGHPDAVLPRIKAYLRRHPKGEWHRKGLLLWARVNEDIWHIHRKWSWVLYNYRVLPEELIIRAEPYRQEALRTYKDLMRVKKTFEGKRAAAEYALIEANREDGQTYSIVDDSNVGTLDVWGIWLPGASSKGWEDDATGAGRAPQAPGKAPEVPQRWK